VRFVGIPLCAAFSGAYHRGSGLTDAQQSSNGEIRLKRASDQAVSERAERLLAALKRRRWANLSQVGMNDDLSRAAARLLREQKRIVEVGKVGRLAAFATVEDTSPDDRLHALADQELRERVQKPQLVLLPLAKDHQMYKDLPSRVRERLLVVIRGAVSRGEGFPVPVGRSKFVVLASNMAFVLESHGLSSASAAVPPATDRGAAGAGTVDVDAVRRAYSRLMREGRSPNVVISELRREVQVPLETFKEWLLAECRAHRAFPLLGEPTHATPEQLEAALQIQGRPHLYVRFADGGAP
jgi:hypothetical protein